MLLVLLGMPKNDEGISSWLKKEHIPPLSDLEPGPEGFLLKKQDNKDVIVAAGIDERGCLYAVGEFLRQATIRNGILKFPIILKFGQPLLLKSVGLRYSKAIFQRNWGKPVPGATRKFTGLFSTMLSPVQISSQPVMVLLSISLNRMD